MIIDIVECLFLLSPTWQTRKLSSKKGIPGTSLVTQWLRLCAPNAGGPDSLPGQGTRSHMHAATKSSNATTKDPACRNQDLVQPNK